MNDYSQFTALLLAYALLVLDEININFKLMFVFLYIYMCFLKIIYYCVAVVIIFVTHEENPLFW